MIHQQSMKNGANGVFGYIFTSKTDLHDCVNILMPFSIDYIQSHSKVIINLRKCEVSQRS